MLNPSINEILMDDIDSRYTLVMLAAKRARQLIDGAEPLIKTSSKKPVSIAIEEIIEGKMEYTKPNINSIK